MAIVCVGLPVLKQFTWGMGFADGLNLVGFRSGSMPGVSVRFGAFSIGMLSTKLIVPMPLKQSSLLRLQSHDHD